jgi:hypothetical protein
VVDQVAIDDAGNGTPSYDHLRQVPADGTFIQGAQTAKVYRVEAGVPNYVPNWAPYGGPQPCVIVDQAAIDNAGQLGKWSHLK